MRFAAALFLSVLTDQVCFTHFKASYPEFRRLTQYPKWRGDCPGGCAWHLHPSLIFDAIGSRPGPLPRERSPRFDLLPPDVFSVFELETKDFVREYLPEVSATRFWERCVRELPPGLRLLPPAAESP